MTKQVPSLTNQLVGNSPFFLFCYDGSNAVELDFAVSQLNWFVFFELIVFY